MKKIIVCMVLWCGFCYAVEPEKATPITTQIKEQIQRIEVPSHIKGLSIVNNNTLHVRDTMQPWKDPQRTLDYYPEYPVHPRTALQPEQSSAHKRTSGWRCTIGGIVCAAVVYSAVRAYVHLLAQELDNKARWWNWKADVLFITVTEESEKQLAQELLLQIQQRYDKKTVNDVAFIMPLVHFIQDTNHEQGYLEHLIKVYEVVRSCHIHHLIAADEQILTHARVKLARLAYIRTLCMKWLSTYAVDVPTGY
ncbi:MAG: hypothetical protein ACHQVS_00450 [Candidatus Babeliales bacterium]